MKKLSLILIAIITLIGCSGEDAPQTINQINIESKWKPEAVTYQGNTSDILNTCAQNGVLWVKSDGTITEYSSTGANCTTVTYNYTYEIDGAVLTLHEDEYLTQANIIVVNEGLIKLEWFYDSVDGMYPSNQRETVWYTKI